MGVILGERIEGVGSGVCSVTRGEIATAANSPLALDLGKTISSLLFRMMDVSWHHPFTLLVSGPSSSGKTVFVENLLKNRFDLIHPLPHRLFWSYGIHQPALESRWRGVVDFVPGLSSIENIPRNSLVVIDDQMSETNEVISNLFTKGSHHNNLSVIYIIQNLFGKNPHLRTISLNAHYLVLFKNPRDASQAINLGKQMYPKRSAFFQEAYKDATSRPHGYLLCDLRQETSEQLRLRTGIFPEDRDHIVYLEK